MGRFQRSKLAPGEFVVKYSKYSPHLIDKMDSKPLSLATTPILGQPPGRLSESREPTAEKPTLNDLVEALRPAFPSLNREEQKVSLQVHRLLAQGLPLTHQDVADNLEISLGRIDAMLNSWWGIHYDARNRIVAYWGLSLEPTQHRFEVDERILYAWCAWDTLFLPEILHKSARVTFQCRVTGSTISLVLTPNSVQKVSPKDACISFLTPETVRVKESIVDHFCHYVNFFESPDVALVWTKKHPRTFLLS